MRLSAPKRKLGLILHIGAGKGRNLGEFVAFDPQAVVLVEPNPSYSERLAKQIAEQPNATAVFQAIGATTGKVALNVFNLPDLNSIEPGENIQSVYPGARIEDKEQVACVKLNDLLERHNPLPDLENWLIIDTPGSEAEILKQVFNGTGQRFDRVMFRVSQDPLYKPSRPAAAMIELAQTADYSVKAVWIDDDPEWIWVDLDYDPRIKDLKQAIANGATTLETAQARIKELEEKLAAETIARENAVANVAVQWEQSEDDLQSIDSLTRENLDLTKRQAQLQKELLRAEGQVRLITDMLLRETSA